MAIEASLAVDHLQADVDCGFVQPGLFEGGQGLRMHAQCAGVLTLTGVDRRSKLVDAKRVGELTTRNEDVGRGLAQVDSRVEAAEQDERLRLVRHGLRDPLVGNGAKVRTCLFKVTDGSVIQG